MGKYSEDLREAISGVSYTEADFDVNGKGKIVTLYAKPLTPADFQAITRKHPTFMSNPTFEGMIDLLIRKCLDDLEEKSKAFDLVDKEFLMRRAANVIGDLFNKLFSAQMEVSADESMKDAAEK